MLDTTVDGEIEVVNCEIASTVNNYSILTVTNKFPTQSERAQQSITGALTPELFFEDSVRQTVVKGRIGGRLMMEKTQLEDEKLKKSMRGNK